jgi:hypothetical protein
MIASQAGKPSPREHLRQQALGRGGNRGHWNSPLRFASGRLGAVNVVALLADIRGNQADAHQTCEDCAAQTDRENRFQRCGRARTPNTA